MSVIISEEHFIKERCKIHNNFIEDDACAVNVFNFLDPAAPFDREVRVARSPTGIVDHLASPARRRAVRSFSRSPYHRSRSAPERASTSARSASSEAPRAALRSLRKGLSIRLVFAERRRVGPSIITYLTLREQSGGRGVKKFPRRRPWKARSSYIWLC